VAEANAAATPGDWGIVRIASGVNPVLSSTISARGVLIRGGGAVVDGPPSVALAVCGPGLRIEDLTITGSGQGIGNDGTYGQCVGARVEVVRSHVDGNRGYGIQFLTGGMSLLLSSSTVSGNGTADDGEGGGIDAFLSEFWSVQSTIADNTGPGATITTTSGATVALTVVARNTYGGFVHLSPAPVVVVGSTFADNTGSDSFNIGEAANIVARSTFEGNLYGPRLGGGSVMTDSTVTGNIETGLSANSGIVRVVRSTVSSQILGSFPPEYSYGILDFQASIVQAEAGMLCVDESEVHSSGWNLVSEPSCAFDGPGDQVGSALLGPLSTEGGPTQVRMPGTGSPAIDAVPSGTPGACDPSVPDQRGVSRPQGAGCDIGAVEQAGP
jgi:hypothetical protein